MAKNINKKVETLETPIPTASENLATDNAKVGADILRGKFETYPSTTLSAIAKVAGVKYDKLMYKSRLPVEGEVYDPKAYNFFEMAKVLGADKLLALNWDEIQEQSHKAPVKKNTILDNLKVGDNLMIKAYPERTFKVIFMNPTHVVVLSDENIPYAWINSTFLFKGPAKAEVIE